MGFFVAVHMDENDMLNFNDLRPYGRLQLQNMIMTQSLSKERGTKGGRFVYIRH